MEQQDAAEAAARELMLRHRMFPRAMAWTAVRQQQQAAPAEAPSSFVAAEEVAASSDELLERHVHEQRRAFHRLSMREHNEQPMQSTVSDQAVNEAMQFARAFPLLQVSSSVSPSSSTSSMRSTGGMDRMAAMVDALPRPEPVAHQTPPREHLFRSMGKWLDGIEGSRVAMLQQAAIENQQQLHQPPQSFPMQPPVPTSTYMYSENQPPLYNQQQQQSPIWIDSMAAPIAPKSARLEPRTSMTALLSEVPPDALQPPSSSSSKPSSIASAHGKKRSRPTMAPSLLKALASGTGAKRCSVDDCGKIAVSKGLCRGHGGGRRCQFAACNKCAQSRSPFCWAHGGGKRCEAPNCRRSRKTKRFCVDHVDMELTTPVDSDESIGGSCSTRTSDSEAHASASRRERVEIKTHLVLQTQLPSLNEALRRAIPSSMASGALPPTTPRKGDLVWLQAGRRPPDASQ